MPEQLRRWRLSDMQVDHINQLAGLGVHTIDGGAVVVELQEDGALIFKSTGEPNAQQRVEPADA